MNQFNIYNKEYDLVRYNKMIYDITVRSKKRLSRNNIDSFKEMIVLTVYNTSLEMRFNEIKSNWSLK